MATDHPSANLAGNAIFSVIRNITDAADTDNIPSVLAAFFLPSPPVLTNRPAIPAAVGKNSPIRLSTGLGSSGFTGLGIAFFHGEHIVLFPDFPSFFQITFQLLFCHASADHRTRRNTGITSSGASVSIHCPPSNRSRLFRFSHCSFAGRYTFLPVCPA